MLEFIAFDADDTLWHNEIHFTQAQDEFKRIMRDYLNGACEGEQLCQTEIANLQHYGYGVKGFGLSMIETAIQLTGGQIDAQHIQGLIELTKEMLSAPVRILPDVEAVLDELSGDYPLFLITKGDLLDQQNKIRRSGLGEFFRYVEVVSEKDPHTYRNLLRRYRIRPDEFLMVGNSLRSDILPVVEVGASAVYIPHQQTWNHEVVQLEDDQPRPFVQLEAIGQLPEWLESRLLAA